MKKIISILLIIVMITVMLCGCGNSTLFDTTYYFDRAIVQLPNGEVVEGTLTKWCDYESDAIQVTIDGNTYYTHLDNVVLIAN